MGALAYQLKKRGILSSSKTTRSKYNRIGISQDRALSTDYFKLL